MVELIANGLQTVKPGGVILFDDATAVNNNSVMHREGSGIATIRNGGCACRGTRAIVATFGANIAFPTTAPSGETSATAPLSLAFAISGEPDTSTEMIITPSAADVFMNVNRSTLVEIPGGCCTQISIENTSNGTISVENARLLIID